MMLAFALFIPQVWAVLPEDFNTNEHCQLSREVHGGSSVKLDLCEKYNKDSCCLPSHDAVILESFESLTARGRSCGVSGNARDHPLARLLCMGCDPRQTKFITVTEQTKEVRICESFAQEFWAHSDNTDCGLRIQDGSNDPYVILPKSLHPTFVEFMNGAFSGRIPGFETGWTLRVVSESSEEECFDGHGTIATPKMIIILTGLAMNFVVSLG